VNMNAATFQNLAASLFIVNPLLGPIFNPETPASNPNNVGWFQPQPGSTYTCSAIPFPCGLPSLTTDGGSELLKNQIALNNNVSSAFIAESKNIARMQLFDELKRNPALLSGNIILQNFFAQNDTGAIGNLYAAQSAIANAFKYSMANETSLIFADSMMQIYTDSIRSIDALAILNPAMNFSLQRQLLINNLNGWQDALNNIKSAHGQHADSMLTIAWTKNELAQPLFAPEANGKFMNDMLIKFIKGGKDSIAQYYGQIAAIAIACPYQGGTAVYSARAIAEIFNDSLEYNDELSCANAGSRNSNDSQITISDEEIKIVPSPATGFAEIIIPKHYAGGCGLIITDAMGRKKYDATLDCGIKRHSLNLQQLDAGIYFVQVKAEEKISIIKIVLVK